MIDFVYHSMFILLNLIVLDQYVFIKIIEYDLVNTFIKPEREKTNDGLV
jgi:hypothetical protein